MGKDIGTIQARVLGPASAGPGRPPVVGDRRYDQEALTRLDLVRTLHELGLPLDTIRVLLAEQTSLI